MSPLVTIAQYRIDNDHMDGSWEWAMVVMMILVLVAVVVLVVWLFRSMDQGRRDGATPSAESAIDLLDRRLAQGDITPDEYRERADILTRR